MRAVAVAVALLAILLYYFSTLPSASLPLLEWTSTSITLRMPASSASAGYAAPSDVVRPEQLILFGDSLFQHSSSQERGFNLAPALQHEFIRRLDVVNRGFSGYNTNQALHILPRILPDPAHSRIRFFFILLGANDACLEGASGSQHVPLARYKKNLHDIIAHPLLKAHDPRIVLVSPPPINEYASDENDRSKGYEQRRTAEHTLLYSEAAKEVAREANVTTIDLVSLFLNECGWREGDEKLPGSKQLPEQPPLKRLLHDGLHFTNFAYTLFFTEIMKTIERVWPDQMPQKQSYVLPEWNKPGVWPEGEGQ